MKIRSKAFAIRFVALMAVVALLVAGMFVYQKVVNPNHLGQVLFTTQRPVGLLVQIKGTCKITDEVSSVKVGTSVWSVYRYSRRLEVDEPLVEEDFKDGVSIYKYDIPTTSSWNIDCLFIEDDLSAEFTAPGTYEVKLTTGAEVVADGKLTVTP